MEGKKLEAHDTLYFNYETLTEQEKEAMHPEYAKLDELMSIYKRPNIPVCPATNRPIFHMAFKSLASTAPKAVVHPRVVEEKLEDGSSVAVYYPSQYRPGEVLPGLVFFFGGGWVTGGVEPWEFYIKLMVHLTGCIVVAHDYPLSPEVQFPELPQSCCRAVRKVFERAEEWGVDKNRVGVWGSSAGATLAAGVSLMLREEKGLAIHLQVLCCPPLDSRCNSPSYESNRNKYFALASDQMRIFWQFYLPEAHRNDRRASPLLWAEEGLQGVAPAIVVTAGLDPLGWEGQEYARKLGQANLLLKHLDFPTVTHCPDVNLSTREAKQLWRTLAQQVRTFFKIPEDEAAYTILNL